MPGDARKKDADAKAAAKIKQEKAASDMVFLAEQASLNSWKKARGKRDRVGDLAFLAKVASTGGRPEDAIPLFGAMCDLPHGHYRPMSVEEQALFVNTVKMYCTPIRQAMMKVKDMVVQYGHTVSILKALPDTDTQWMNAKDVSKGRGIGIEIADVNERWDRAKSYLAMLRMQLQNFLVRVNEIIAVERSKAMAYFTDMAPVSSDEDELNEDEKDPIGEAEQERQSVLYINWGRLIGDISRYELECNLQSVTLDRALAAYEGTRKYALKRLPPAHPARVAIAMNTAIFFAENMNSARKAIGIANVCLADALQGLSSGDSAIGADDMGKVVLLLQELQQLLKAWKKQQVADDAYSEEHRMLYTSANKGVRIEKEGFCAIFMKCPGIALVSAKSKPEGPLKEGATSITLELTKCGPKGVCIGVCTSEYKGTAVGATYEGKDLHPTKRGAWCVCSNGSLWSNGSETEGHHASWHKQGISVTLTYTTKGSTVGQLEWKVGSDKQPPVDVPGPAQAKLFLCVCGSERTEWRIH
jgi:hypothetical protein